MLFIVANEGNTKEYVLNIFVTQNKKKQDDSVAETLLATVVAEDAGRVECIPLSKINLQEFFYPEVQKVQPLSNIISSRVSAKNAVVQVFFWV